MRVCVVIVIIATREIHGDRSNDSAEAAANVIAAATSTPDLATEDIGVPHAAAKEAVKGLL